MKTHFLQHVPFEGLGSIRTWLVNQSASISCTRFFLGESLPDPKGFNFIAVMGGPMSANDEKEHPWLKEEKEFIRAVIDRGVPLLGVCLGAQLIASALGSGVYANKVKEIGWFPVGAAAASSRCFRFPEEFTVFHWHGETFDLPRGAERLAQSPGCGNQAFQLGRRAIGLQFHLETEPEGACAMVGNCASDLTPGPYVQNAAEILAAPVERYSRANSLMAEVLEYLSGSD